MTNRVVRDLRELQSLAELRRVLVYELTGRRKDGFGLESTTEDLGRSDVNVSIVLGSDALIFRCRTDINTQAAIFAVDIAIVFSLREPIEEPADELLDQFSEHALPIAISYLRVHLQQISRQLNVPTPLLKHRWPHEMASFRQKLEDGTEPPGR